VPSWGAATITLKHITVARKVGSDSAKTLAAIRRAGIAQLYQHGYEAMSLRDLAAAVGLQAGSLYNYFRTKEDLLETLLIEHMQALNQSARVALAAAEPHSADAAWAGVEALIEFHVRYYATRKKDVYVANSELRSLKAVRRARVVRLRREYEDLWVAELQRAAGASGIAPQDLRVTAYALIAMLTGVCTWYSPKGRLSLNELVATHKALVLQGLGVLAGQPSRALPKTRRHLREGGSDALHLDSQVAPTVNKAAA
jgi:AcrR family transcriptional regulator